MTNMSKKEIPDLETYQKELQKYQEEHARLTLLLNVTRNISHEIKLDRLLMLIMDEVKRVLECDRCTVFVLDREYKELWSRVAHGEEEIRFPSDIGIAGHVATTGEVLNIPDAYADTRFNPNIDKKTGYLTRNILTAPMRNRPGEIIGVFQALNKFDGPFTKDDENLLDAISVIAATQIENAQLYDEQKKTFDSFIETLASTIDARDPLTAGHSKRIALFADEVAKVLDMDDQQREVLRTAAMLHDYGKIAVREAVLTKDGPLTDEEYHHIQSHPGYTKSILEKINFSRELRSVPLIAATHHEKLDGSGYPSGLVADQIPEMGKILAVADVVDALTSKRHYRDRMDFHKVMGILKDESGSHFDENFVNAFKKIRVGDLIAVLEDEHRTSLDDNDVGFLNKYKIWDLIECLESHSISNEKQQLVKRFNHYYNRTYLKRQKND
jgi:hypothetical protein